VRRWPVCRRPTTAPLLMPPARSRLHPDRRDGAVATSKLRLEMRHHNNAALEVTTSVGGPGPLWHGASRGAHARRMGSPCGRNMLRARSRAPTANCTDRGPHLSRGGCAATAEGQFPWKLVPDSIMTKATVAGIRSAPQGEVLKVTYKGGEAEVIVPPDRS